MNYRLILTSNGPAVLGEDEVVFLNQSPELLDYYESDPEFLKNVRAFLAASIREVGEYLAQTAEGTQVIGGDWTMKMHGLANSVNLLNSFEYQYLPSVPGFIRQ